MYNSVCINVEGHLNLRHTPWCRRNTDQLKTSQCLIISRHFSLALQDMNTNRRLVVCGSRESLTFSGRNGGVTFNKFRHNTTKSFNSKRKRSNVEKQYILHITGENTSLNRSADGHNFVRIYAFVRFFSKKIFDHFLYFRHSRHPAHQNYFIDILCGTSCVF